MRASDAAASAAFPQQHPRAPSIRFRSYRAKAEASGPDGRSPQGASFNHFSRPGLLLLFHAALALKRFQRFGEDFRRRFAVDASAFTVEVNRIGMQYRQQCRELYGRRLLTPVFWARSLKENSSAGAASQRKAGSSSAAASGIRAISSEALGVSKGKRHERP